MKKYLFLIALFGFYAEEFSIMENSFQYGGEYKDSRTHLLYLKARYLDQNLGIAYFITRDYGKAREQKTLFDADYNAFAGNPIMNEDPSGHQPSRVKELAAGVLPVINNIGFFLNAAGYFTDFITAYKLKSITEEKMLKNEMLRYLPKISDRVFMFGCFSAVLGLTSTILSITSNYATKNANTKDMLNELSYYANMLSSATSILANPGISSKLLNVAALGTAILPLAYNKSSDIANIVSLFMGAIASLVSLKNAYEMSSFFSSDNRGPGPGAQSVTVFRWNSFFGVVSSDKVDINTINLGDPPPPKSAPTSPGRNPPSISTYSERYLKKRSPRATVIEMGNLEE